MYCICIVFIHFYSASHSTSLSEALPTTAIDTVSEFTCRSGRHLLVKDLPTGRISGGQSGIRTCAPRDGRHRTLPLSHHAPQVLKQNNWFKQLFYSTRLFMSNHRNTATYNVQYMYRLRQMTRCCCAKFSQTYSMFPIPHRKTTINLLR